MQFRKEVQDGNTAVLKKMVDGEFTIRINQTKDLRFKDSNGGYSQDA